MGESEAGEAARGKPKRGAGAKNPRASLCYFTNSLREQFSKGSVQSGMGRRSIWFGDVFKLSNSNWECYGNPGLRSVVSMLIAAERSIPTGNP
jgi:hypothetical protein